MINMIVKQKEDMDDFYFFKYFNLNISLSLLFLLGRYYKLCSIITIMLCLKGLCFVLIHN